MTYYYKWIERNDMIEITVQVVLLDELDKLCVTFLHHLVVSRP